MIVVTCNALSSIYLTLTARISDKILSNTLRWFQSSTYLSQLTIIANNSDIFKITAAKLLPVACKRKPQSQVSFHGGYLGLFLMTEFDDITWLLDAELAEHTRSWFRMKVFFFVNGRRRREILTNLNFQTFLKELWIRNKSNPPS